MSRNTERTNTMWEKDLKRTRQIPKFTPSNGGALLMDWLETTTHNALDASLPTLVTDVDVAVAFDGVSWWEHGEAETA